MFIAYTTVDLLCSDDSGIIQPTSLVTYPRRYARGWFCRVCTAKRLIRKASRLSPSKSVEVPKAVLHVRDVERIDLKAIKVICSAGLRLRSLELPFDHLVITLGNITNFRGMTGMAKHACPFNTISPHFSPPQ